MPTQLGAQFSKPFMEKRSLRSPAVDARVARSRKRLEVAQSGLRPSISIQHAYRRALLKMLREMDKSVRYWLGARFKQTEEQREKVVNPTMAMDATAAEELQKAIRDLRNRWQGRFDRMAQELAAYFAKSVAARTDSDLKRILKKGGIAIEFVPTPTMKEALSAIVQENVSLIKSIPQQYLQEVEGMTMRAVLAGSDLHTLYKDLRKRYGVTERRAELIARDQGNKATSSLTKIRYQEAGIEEAIWLHSHAGREPRPTHVANDGKRYNVATGWYDPHEKKFIQPGWLINCRCFSKPLI